MRGKLLFLFLIFLFSGSGFSSGDDGQKQKEAAALNAAKEWLRLIDTGEYLESWRKASGILQSAMAQDKWVQTMRNGRKPFGAAISRKLKGSRYMLNLPGAPKGEYVVIQFETLFENRKGIVVETVTPMLDSEKKWRISGYYIR